MICSVKTPPVWLSSHGPGRRRDVDGLRAHLLPLVEFERAVVEAAGQAEAVFGERELAVEVAPEHRADLRDGLVAFVDEDHRVFGQVFEQGGRRLAGSAAGEIAAVVLDAGAGAGGHHHLDVELAALLEALGLEQLALLRRARSRRPRSSSLMCSTAWFSVGRGVT